LAWASRWAAWRIASRPAREAWASFGLLLLSLVSVVGLAKMLSPAIEQAVESAEAPQAVVGVVIAALVLLPETWAATRAARARCWVWNGGAGRGSPARSSSARSPSALAAPTRYRGPFHLVLFAAFLFLAFVP